MYTATTQDNDTLKLKTWNISLNHMLKRYITNPKKKVVAEFGDTLAMKTIKSTARKKQQEKKVCSTKPQIIL